MNTPKYPSISVRAKDSRVNSGGEHAHDDDARHKHSLDALEVIRIIGVAAAAAAVWFHVWEPFSSASLIGGLGVLIGGWTIYREAGENILARRMTMELSMSIAILAAAA